MKKTKNKINKAKILITFILVILVPILFFYVLKLLNPESFIFSIDEVKIQQYIDSVGYLGVFVYILIQTFTIIFPPIPNLIVMIAGGLLFGAELGILYSLIGVMIGVTINFYLTRFFGRRVIKKILNSSEIEWMDKFADKINWKIVVILPFIPGMYADIGGYSAGLSNMRFTKYFFSIGLGYILLVSLANLLGALVVKNPVLRAALIFVILAGAVSIFLIPLFKWIKKKIV